MKLSNVEIAKYISSELDYDFDKALNHIDIGRNEELENQDLKSCEKEYLLKSYKAGFKELIEYENSGSL